MHALKNNTQVYYLFSKLAELVRSYIQYRPLKVARKDVSTKGTTYFKNTSNQEYVYSVSPNFRMWVVISVEV